MENSGMKIEQPINEVTKQRDPLYITMKPGYDDKTLYHNLVNIIEWSSKVNGNDAQKVMDWLKERNWFQEHVYNPVV